MQAAHHTATSTTDDLSIAQRAATAPATIAKLIATKESYEKHRRSIG
jgi:hypothetical protein